MIFCPNCNHENPEGATLCETCYTPLPVSSKCPSCGATIQTDATFCGQCGFNLAPNNDEIENREEAVVEIAENEELEGQKQPTFILSANKSLENLSPEPEISPGQEIELETEIDVEEAGSDTTYGVIIPKNAPTQLQIQRATLLHVQTNSNIELPQDLQVIHLGKPNDKITPDIDVSGLPNAQFVSRVHADIRIEGDAFYIEDTGSANGTYINHIPLAKGNRYRLRRGDRIALGKEDKVSFIFQLSSE
jgi:pSer/pThr/pTyr-binding forkhead associated (FHA) protein/ribosomal protein L40E